MENPPVSEPDEIKRIQLATAKADLKLKELDLLIRPSIFRQIFTNPAFLAAVITVCITGATTFIAENAARRQREAEAQRAEIQRQIDMAKARSETNKSILLGVINPGDAFSIAAKLKLFIDTGLIDDPENRFRNAQRKLEDQSLQAILLNILRASRNRPMSFPYETSSFYQGLLRPVDLPILNYFLRQGYSHELLFWLFIELVRQTMDDQTIELLNHPRQSRACQSVDGRDQCFLHFVDLAMASGLTVEVKLEEEPGKGTRTVARFCFDPVLAARMRSEYHPADFLHSLATTKADLSPRCNIDPWVASIATDILVFSFERAPSDVVRYEIKTRSTFGIFQFLGRIIALGLPEEVKLRRPRVELEDLRLLSITTKKGRDLASSCFVEVEYDKNESFCVPEKGAENTKRTFSLLQQLIALNTSTFDTTPTIRIAP